MKLLLNFLFIIVLSISLSSYGRLRPVPPHTRSGDMNLRVRNYYTLKVGQRGYYLYNQSSMIGYNYKFKIGNENILKFEKYYRLTPFRENYRGNYFGETTDHIHFYKAIKKGKTTLTAYYIQKGQVRFKDVIYISVK